MKTVAVTGAGGFLGSNLMVRLREQGFAPVAILHQAEMAELRDLLAPAEIVVHLAGVNRPPDESAFATGNVGMTERVLSVLQELGAATPIIFSSSVQAELDNPYGRSKRDAESAIESYGRLTGAGTAIFRLPNVFGKWCRPNYNSVVATFCHNISRGLPIRIDDPARELRLVYIDDVVDSLIALLAAPFPSGSRPAVEPVYRITVADLARRLEVFRDSRSTLLTGAVGTGLDRALHATYLSYLEPAAFDYPLQAHADARGTFVEMLRTPDSGQFSYFTAYPGITRGGHYHHTKTEKFLVLQGKARFGFRHILTGETASLDTSGDVPRVVETVPGWAHDVTNIGEETLVVALWANELFDRQRPDTIAAKVVAP